MLHFIKWLSGEQMGGLSLDLKVDDLVKLSEISSVKELNKHGHWFSLYETLNLQPKLTEGYHTKPLHQLI